jgi:hypothetical protein
MENQSAASLSNLQVLIGRYSSHCLVEAVVKLLVGAGAVGAISNDLSNLRQSIEESAQPGPWLLLGVEKKKLLELWELLKNEGKDSFWCRFNFDSLTGLSC